MQLAQQTDDFAIDGNMGGLARMQSRMIRQRLEIHINRGKESLHNPLQVIIIARPFAFPPLRRIALPDNDSRQPRRLRRQFPAAPDKKHLPISKRQIRSRR